MARDVNRDEIYKRVRARDPEGVVTKKLIGWEGTPSYEANSRSWNGCAYECYLCHREFTTLGGLNQHLNSQAREYTAISPHPPVPASNFVFLRPEQPLPLPQVPDGIQEPSFLLQSSGERSLRIHEVPDRSRQSWGNGPGWSTSNTLRWDPILVETPLPRGSGWMC